jgi:tetratricopeptide (TPR) repeat protein
MPPPDAAALFARVSGRDHVDDPAVASVLRLCGYFPLEIQLAGSKLRRHPTWGADDLARRLREVRTEDRPVGTALALSCHYLTASQHQLLRQLALHPGPDFSSHAAAAAAGERSHADISSILDALQDCYLIEESAPGRYSFHDLVRSYAWHLTLTRDTDDDRQRTMQRIVDYYLRLADSADRAIFPGRRRSPARIGHVTGSSPTLRTTRDYRKWMETEQQTMLAVARSAIDQGLSEQASLLAHVLAHFLETRSCWADAADLHRRAVHTWRAAGNARGEARALIDLCHVLGRIGRNEEATDCAIQALAIVRNAPDPATEAEIHDSLGLILWQTSRYPEAMSHYEQALAVWRTLGDRHGEADVLAHSAAALWHVNRYSEAVRRTEQALAAYRELDDMRGVANTLNNLGDLHLGADHHQQASESYQLAREMFQSIGDRLGESTTLSNIGDIRRETGQGKEALPYYRTALDICREIGNPRYEANILNNLGAAYLQLGYYENALDQYQKGLVLAHGLAERFLEAQSHRGSGDAHLAVGNPRSADVSYRTALELSQRIGDQYLEAQALHGLGQTLANEHDVVAAAEHLREALGIFTSIGKSRDADMVRVHLHELGNNVA